jgi:hypothetical protein
VRRWRNLPFRRGSYWQLPAAPPTGVPSAASQRRTARLARPPRGQFLTVPVPPAAVVTAQAGVPQAPQHRAPRLARPPRGQFFPTPVPATAVTSPPSWVAPLLRQGRRWLPVRRRTPIAAPAVAAAAAPAGISRHPLRAGRPARGQFLTVPPQRQTAPVPAAATHALRVARPPRGQFFAVPVPAPAAGTPGPLVPAHLHQRRTWPPRIPHSHRADPPWQGQAAPAATPPAPQIPRQAPVRARLPRRGCLFAVPPSRLQPPVPAGRRTRPGIPPARRGCIFSLPPAAPGRPGPLVAPVIRPAGNRPRWPALPRRGRRLQIPLVGAPPPAFSIGALTATDTGRSTLTAGQAANALTATTAATAAITATDQRTGGPA